MSRDDRASALLPAALSALPRAIRVPLLILVAQRSRCLLPAAAVDWEHRLAPWVPAKYHSSEIPAGFPAQTGGASGPSSALSSGPSAPAAPSSAPVAGFGGLSVAAPGSGTLQPSGTASGALSTETGGPSGPSSGFTSGPAAPHPPLADSGSGSMVLSAPGTAQGQPSGFISSADNSGGLVATGSPGSGLNPFGPPEAPPADRAPKIQPMTGSSPPVSATGASNTPSAPTVINATPLASALPVEGVPGARTPASGGVQPRSAEAANGPGNGNAVPQGAAGADGANDGPSVQDPWQTIPDPGGRRSRDITPRADRSDVSETWIG